MNVARLFDIGSGICCCHPPIPCIGMTGRVITVSNNVLTNGLGTCKMFSIVMGGCGHTGVMISASSTVITNGLGTCRLGDRFSGCFSGSLIQGSPNVNAG